MAWLVENRRQEQIERREEPYLNEEMKLDIAKKYFPRYPTKRAVTLPALHHVQHHYGWIPMQAIEEIAEFLELQPAEVLDTATFYEEYWLKPKGKYLVQVCRSLACEICGHKELTQRVKDKLGIEIGETTADGKFTLVELECLGSCGTAPVALVNEVLHENLTAGNLEKVLDELPEDPHEYKDPEVTWEGSGRATERRSDEATKGG
jgi:NADH-quinone oxidoreductase E subunit